MHSFILRAAALTAFLLAALPAAQAQSVHRCTDGTRTYWSDKPCGSNGQTRITNYGPTPTRESSPSYSSRSEPSLAKAPEYQAYLSQECASILDALRTAETRGVGVSTQRELFDEYVQKCRENDREARRKAYEAREKKSAEAREERVAQQQQKAQATATLEQCRELGRILAERRRRQDSMNAGERADLERSQTNFNERCKGL